MWEWERERERKGEEARGRVRSQPPIIWGVTAGTVMAGKLPLTLRYPCGAQLNCRYLIMCS